VSDTVIFSLCYDTDMRTHVIDTDIRGTQLNPHLVSHGIGLDVDLSERNEKQE